MNVSCKLICFVYITHLLWISRGIRVGRRDRRAKHYFAEVALMVEQGFCKPQVAGSSPVLGSNESPP